MWDVVSQPTMDFASSTSRSPGDTSMLLTGSATIDAERAFTREARARRRAALGRRLHRRPADSARLPVYDERRLSRSHAAGGRGRVEIPLGAVTATLEPSRAPLFDSSFRPAPAARTRWQRIWIAENRGTVLPPISVVRVGDTYAVRDGHHRVSVAKARGALTIDATVDATA
jgi:hypothetical protein